MSAFVINPYRFAAGGISSPLDISGCVGWWDFSDETTMFTDTAGTTQVSADGDSVARINDKSSTAYHLTQSTSGNRPTYKTAIKNSRSIGRFDGADFLAGSGNYAISGSSNRSVFTVFQRDDASQRYIVSWGGVATGAFMGFSSEYYLRFSSTTKGYTNQGANGSWTLWSVIGGGSTLDGYDAYFNGGGAATPNATNSTGTSINTTASALSIGANNVNGANIIDGDLAEVIIYNSALSSTDREAVRDYLNDKWAVY